MVETVVAVSLAVLAGLAVLAVLVVLIWAIKKQCRAKAQVQIQAQAQSQAQSQAQAQAHRAQEPSEASDFQKSEAERADGFVRLRTAQNRQLAISYMEAAKKAEDNYMDRLKNIT